ncbi:hypothetical protein V6N13_032054 [Hibiscus sabdariffa]|uniref:RNase H type-1 domain-containing protein n=2 Tax=Hibiscus sabdariffa TaxID=183260 RepID=A0ABR2N9J5_9ROSI
MGSSLVNSIHELINRSLDVKVRHACRELNVVVDKLASISRGGPISGIILSQPHLTTIDIIQDEMEPEYPDAMMGHLDLVAVMTLWSHCYRVLPFLVVLKVFF